MAIDFPNSPSNGDIHTVSGKRWQWDGEKWQAYGASLAPDVLYVDQGNARVGINDTTPTYSLDVTGTAHVTGVITASGGVVGNVTGNTSGTALTVTQAAQTAITSVGTLTGLTVSGDLTVNGTTTTINSTTLTVDDKNIELGSVATPTDTTADGGGITLKGATDKTIQWTNSTDTWDFNQGINVTGTATATAFAGPLTGNVTGNTSGTALTVTQAAQSAITSVGTLTGLATTGEVTVGSNGSGHDVQFFGDTSGAYALWDESADQLHLYNSLLVVGNTTDAVDMGLVGGLATIRGINVGTNAYNDLSIRCTSGTQLYLDTAGNVGIGNSSPHAAARLHVDGKNIFLQDKTTIGRTDSGAMAIFGHNVYASTTANNTVNCKDANYYGQFMKMYHAYGITFHVSTAGHSANAVVQNSWTGASTTNICDEAVQIQRGTQGGQLRIRGYGTDEGGQLHLDGGSSYTGDFYIDRHLNNIRFLWGGSTKVSINNSGDIVNTNNSYGPLSDERLKTDITPARNYLPDLLNLEVVNFVMDKEFVPTRIPELDDDGNPTYKPVPVLDDDGNMTYDADGMPITTNGDAIYNQSPTEGAFEMLDAPGIKQLGLIAQQVELHIPGLVSTDEYGVKAFKSSILVPMLLQAVQTLTARVTELESA